MRIQFIVVCMLLAFVLRAQPTLTYSSNGLSANTIVQMHRGNFLSPSVLIGSNVVWDFSNMADSGLAIPYSYLSCMTAGANCGAYPGSNIVLLKTGGYFDYYISDSTRFALRGMEKSGRLISLNNAEDLLRYPFGMGDKYRDTLSGSYVNMGVKDTLFGFVEVKCSAFGTLILPGKTYQNAILVERYDDFTDIDATTYIKREWTNTGTLSWYVPGERLPVLIEQLNTDLLNGGPTERIAYFRKDSLVPTAVARPRESTTDIQVFPNPSNGLVRFSYSLQSDAMVSVTLSDLAGRIIIQTPASQRRAGKQDQSLDIPSTATGLYFLHVSVDNRSIVQKILVTR